MTLLLINLGNRRWDPGTRDISGKRATSKILFLGLPLAGVTSGIRLEDRIVEQRINSRGRRNHSAWVQSILLSLGVEGRYLPAYFLQFFFHQTI